MTEQPKNERRLNALVVFLILVGLLVVSGALLLAQRRPAAQPPANAKPSVAATIFPLYDIARNVAGDAVTVHLILPPNAEPHSFEPKPSTIAALRGAGAVYAIGHGLDEWIQPTAQSADVAVVTVDRGIAIRPSVTPFSNEEAEQDGTEGADDPHYWLAPANAKIIAANVADDLISRYPDRAGTIRTNLASFQSRLDQLDRELKDKLADVKNRNLITFHGAWYYFADAFGLTVAGTFEPAAADREPTPRYLTALAAAIKQSGVRVVYVEPQFAADAYRAFVEENNLRLVSLDELGGTPGRDSYETLMRYDVQAIADNQ